MTNSYTNLCFFNIVGLEQELQWAYFLIDEQYSLNTIYEIIMKV